MDLFILLLFCAITGLTHAQYVPPYWKPSGVPHPAYSKPKPLPMSQGRLDNIATNPTYAPLDKHLQKRALPLTSLDTVSTGQKAEFRGPPPSSLPSAFHSQEKEFQGSPPPAFDSQETKFGGPSPSASLPTASHAQHEAPSPPPPVSNSPYDVDDKVHFRRPLPPPLLAVNYTPLAERQKPPPSPPRPISTNQGESALVAHHSTDPQLSVNGFQQETQTPSSALIQEQMMKIKNSEQLMENNMSVKPTPPPAVPGYFPEWYMELMKVKNRGQLVDKSPPAVPGYFPEWYMELMKVKNRGQLEEKFPPEAAGYFPEYFALMRQKGSGEYTMNTPIPFPKPPPGYFPEQYVMMLQLSNRGHLAGTNRPSGYF